MAFGAVVLVKDSNPRFAGPNTHEPKFPKSKFPVLAAVRAAFRMDKS
jgi:hypothetical protein